MGNTDTKNENSELKNHVDMLNQQSWDLFHSSPEKTLKLAEEAEKLSIQIDYQAGLAYSLLNQAWYYCDHSDYGLALDYFYTIKNIFTDLGDTEGLLKSFAGISGVNFYIGDYKTTLEYNAKTIEIAREHNFVDRELTATINTVQVYMELEDHDLALSYALKALNIGQDSMSNEQKAILYQEVASIYSSFEDYDKALRFVKAAYSLVIEEKNPEGISDSLLLIGSILEKQGYYDDAENNYFEALKVSSLRNEIVYFKLAGFYYRRDNQKKALEYAKKSYSLSKDTNSKTYLMKSSELIAAIYSLKHQYKKALAYTREFHDYEKTINSEEVERIRQNLAIKFKVEETQRENELNKLKNIELNAKNKELQEHQAILSTLITIGREITSSLDAKEIKKIFLNSITRLMHTTTFGLAYYEPDENKIEYKVFVEDNLDMAPIVHDVNNPTSLAAWCIRNKKEIFISDFEMEHEKYIKTGVFHGKHTESLIFMPIQIGEKILGLITVQSIDKDAYTLLDRKILRILSSYIAIALENSRQHSRVHQLNSRLKQTTSKLWSEMEVARQIQIALLPEQPVIPGFKIEVYMKSADQVGGDYYDVIHFNGRNWVIIGDVSGHGVTAGLFMMMVQTSIITQLTANPGIEPSQLLNISNKVIKHNIEKLGTEKYMTITALTLVGERKFMFAGLHQDIMIFRAAENRVEIVETKGMWIGFLDDISRLSSDSCLELYPGDILLLYTDGLIDAILKGKEDYVNERAVPIRFGVDKLEELLLEHRGGEPEGLKGALVEALRGYFCNDDVTFMILKCLE